MVLRKVVYCLFSALAIVSMTSMGYLTAIEPTTYTQELRTLEPWPGLPHSMAAAREFPAKFEAYWRDATWRRQAMVAIFNRTRMHVGISPQANVVVGKDGWLFLNSEGITNDYRNSELLTAEEVQRWRDYLLFHAAYARKHNATYYFVVPLNTQTVYAEFMPYYITRLSPQSRLDQIIEAVRGTEVQVIDLRPAMQEAKKQRLAYLKGDTHWNLWGANHAQYAILLRMREKYPELSPVLHPPESFVLERWPAFEAANVRYYNGLYWMMGFSGEEADDAQPLLSTLSWDCVQRETMDLGPWDYLDDSIKANIFNAYSCKGGHYRMLAYRDSFSELLEPFFTNAFAFSAYINPPRPLNLDMWQHFVDEVRPDIIVDENVERYLRAVPRPGIDYVEDFGSQDAVIPAAVVSGTAGSGRAGGTARDGA